MGIIGVLEIGKTALAAQQAGIGVTGENIANVNTPGYSRQTAILETAPYNPDQYPAIGNGVIVSSIQRSFDRFLQSQINSNVSAGGEQSTLQSSLQRIEPLFGDLTGDGLGSTLQNFFNAWQDLSMNPQGAAERQAVLAKSQTLLDTFHQINSSLNSVIQDANQSLVMLTTDINNTTSQIAALNDKIRTTQYSGGNTNLLKDSRDQLLQQLAGKIGITVLEQTDGTVTVSLARGPQLVDGHRSAALTLEPDAANSGLFGVVLGQMGGGAGGNGSDVTSLIKSTQGNSGEIGGALQVRDVVARQFLANLDELASSLAVEVNTAHAAGFSLTGVTGVNFFRAPTITPPATFEAGYSNAIALNISKSDEIAASSANPTVNGGSGNNVNALAIAALQNKQLNLTTGDNTILGGYSALVGSVGLAVQTTSQDVAYNTAMLNQLKNVHASTSGVSLDEELIALTKYQKAYEGAAKLITTGQQMIDTLLNMIQ